METNSGDIMMAMEGGDDQYHINIVHGVNNNRRRVTSIYLEALLYLQGHIMVYISA